MPTDEQIRHRVAAKSAADAIFELAAEEACKYTGAGGENRFWLQLKRRIEAVQPTECEAERAEPRPTVQPMPEREAVRFEQMQMVFGKHEGVAIKDVPLDYLFWLDGQREFHAHLQRYLCSDRVQREQ